MPGFVPSNKPTASSAMTHKSSPFDVAPSSSSAPSRIPNFEYSNPAVLPNQKWNNGNKLLSQGDATDSNIPKSSLVQVSSGDVQHPHPHPTVKVTETQSSPGVTIPVDVIGKPPTLVISERTPTTTGPAANIGQSSNSTVYNQTKPTKPPRTSISISIPGNSLGDGDTTKRSN